MPVQDGIKSYSNTYFIIIDSPERDGPPKEPRKGRFEDKHHWNCRQIEYMIEEVTDWEIVRIWIPESFKKKDFSKQIEAELKDKTADDLLIFYYYGTAGDEEKKYSWSFQNAPNKCINAYKLIEDICKSPADSLLLLDCYMPTRITNKWKRERGTTEIITAGGELQDTKGRSLERAGKTFTDGLLHTIKAWFEFLNSKKGAKTTAMQTLPQILSDYKLMPFNPIRIDIRAKAGAGRLRFKMDPDTIRETGKIHFFGEVKYDPKKVLEQREDSCEPEDGEEEAHVSEVQGCQAADEGYDDGERDMAGASGGKPGGDASKATGEAGEESDGKKGDTRKEGGEAEDDGLFMGS